MSYHFFLYLLEWKYNSSSKDNLRQNEEMDPSQAIIFQKNNHAYTRRKKNYPLIIIVDFISFQTWLQKAHTNIVQVFWRHVK